MAPQNPQPVLIPYASHVSHGTGRTPVGIILCAGAHLLLGAVIAAMMVMIIRSLPASAWAKQQNLIWPVLAFALSLPMVAGGLSLLLKGRAAWVICVVSFTGLALAEAFTAVLGAVMFVHATGRSANTWWGLIQGAIATLLMAMSCVVLRYLASEKGRRTFGLQPGETSIGIRWIPRVVLILFVVALLLAALG